MKTLKKNKKINTVVYVRKNRANTEEEGKGKSGGEQWGGKAKGGEAEQRKQGAEPPPRIP